MEKDQWVEIYKWVREGKDPKNIPEGGKKVAKLILHAIADERDKLEDIKAAMDDFLAKNDGRTIEDIFAKIKEIADRRD